MTENRTPTLPAGLQAVPDFTLACGRTLLDDPGAAQLRRYLPVLAVIAAPYANLNGDQDPINPLDREVEWRRLVAAWRAATAQAGAQSTPLALVRLLPSTGAALGEVVARGGADAFRVLHVVAHGERDMLYLEDENGHEAYMVAEHLARVLKPGGAQVVVLEGGFSRRAAELLLKETGVEAVLGAWRRVRDENALAFNTALYAALARGETVREAYRAATGALRRRDMGQADRYDLVLRDESTLRRDVPPDRRAPRPVLCEGVPVMRGVPRYAGFAGRRDQLTQLIEELPAGTRRMVALYGPAGIGKTWLAAELAGRLAWQFPDGVLWFQTDALTRTREIVAQLADLLELPVGTASRDVVAALNRRRVLLVLDRVDMLASTTEQDQLAGLFAGIAPGSTSCALVVGRTIPDRLGRIEDTRLVDVGRLSAKAARTLAMRLAVEHDVDALDVDTIDEFLERTLGVPWLISRGVKQMKLAGFEGALAELADLDADRDDPVGAVLRRHLAQLTAEPERVLRLLVRAQGLVDAFDRGLAEGLAGDRAAEHIDALLERGLLVHDGALLDVPTAVRAYVRDHFPLAAAQLQRLDDAVLRYLVRGRIADEPPLDRAWQARLNNLRAILARRTRAASPDDAGVLARALVVVGPLFRLAGLAEEFLHYAEPVRAQLPEGRDLALLQVAVGEALTVIPGREAEAGIAFQVARGLQDLDVSVRAEAAHHDAQHLLRAGRAAEAAGMVQDALQALLESDRADPANAARLAHDWAAALEAAGRIQDAIPRYGAARAAYVKAQDGMSAALASADLGAALLRTGDLERAEDAYERALKLAPLAGASVLRSTCRRALGRVHVARAEQARRENRIGAARDEWESAARLLSNALADLLACNASEPLAEVYVDLGRVQARLGQVDDAVANVERGQRLFESSGSALDRAAAGVFLGQLRMIQGDSVAAQDVLHRAMEQAASLDDRRVLTQAADVLVRVHEIRARRAAEGDSDFCRDTIEQATVSRAALAGFGLERQAAALDVVLRGLPGG
ncbi:tetratricopeptide repeat protein [Aggregatilinea lenta]|uniref:tetratricopeptide repeat protein n=1 Tax=Aggregatilinea lenta TaxID=913108 RepID=UPI000E5AE33F|nr:tetratricopeptide repeat protein [Aggregatilinea lenta]